MTEITIFRAALAGMISFISPCVMPLIPAYCALLIALSGAGPTDKACNKRPALYSLSFLAGFLAIFIGISASPSFGNFIADYGHYFRITGSLLLALLGIYALIKAGFAVFSQKRDALPNTGAAAYPAALFIGTGVAAGWTPCIGPTLGDILILASTQGTVSSGLLKLVLYSIGLAAPFLAVTLLINAFINLIRKNNIALTAARVVSGSVLAVIAYLLATDGLRQLTKLFPDIVSY
ncbi:MAG: hypothetical protein HZB33_15765 [Nitrospirae bacterium]|nr:hypothetical protein [Nitrospirota bacterium]